MVSKLFLAAVLLGHNIIAAPLNSGGVDLITENERRTLDEYYGGDAARRSEDFTLADVLMTRGDDDHKKHHKDKPAKGPPKKWEKRGDSEDEKKKHHKLKPSEEEPPKKWEKRGDSEDEKKKHHKYKPAKEEPKKWEKRGDSEDEKKKHDDHKNKQKGGEKKQW